MAPATIECMRENFQKIYAEPMKGLPNLQFVEQFDVELADKGDNVQPYAYVADVVEEIRLGVEVGEVMGRGVPNEQWASITELRDQIAPGERVGWFVVVCQDTERHAPSILEDEDEFGEEEYEESVNGEIEAEMQDMSLANGNGHPKPLSVQENVQQNVQESVRENVQENVQQNELAPLKVPSQHSPSVGRSGKSGSESSTAKESVEQRPNTSKGMRKWFSGFGQLKKAKR